VHSESRWQLFNDDSTASDDVGSAQIEWLADMTVMSLFAAVLSGRLVHMDTAPTLRACYVTVGNEKKNGIRR